MYKKERKLNQKNQMPLHIAAKNNSPEIGKILVSKGAEINPKDKKNQIPIHFAAKSNSKELFDLLLSKGANITGIDINSLIIIYFIELKEFNANKRK